MNNPFVRNAIRLIAAALLGYLLLSSQPDLRRNVAKRDSIAYWAAGHLLLSGQNPYDHQVVLQLEKDEGYADPKPLVMRTPPWSLFLALPLGFLSPLWAWIAWISISLLAFVASLHLCWKIFGTGKTPPRFYWLIGYLFAPVPACLVAGQMGTLLLLGIVLFLWLESKHPFWAGTALILPLAKPHLLVLFWVVLVVWSATRVRRSAVLGLITALLVSIAIALTFDQQIFQHYREMLQQAAIGHEFIPALSGVIRLLFFRKLVWVQFIPMAIALIWGLRYYYANRTVWNWREHGPALMVVSILTTPYAWLTDEVVLIPAILQAALWIDSARERVSWKSKLSMLLFAFLNGLLLLILWSKIPFSTGIYFWSSLVWAAWYSFGRRFLREAARQQAHYGELP